MSEIPESECRLFLCGDVMTGRGIDQIQRSHVPPVLHEPYVTDARRYVELAEAVNGAVPAPVAPDYVWGDALHALDRRHPQLRIVNLETAVTTSDAWWQGKGIHYRMHPDNVALLRAADIDVCVLANNHVMDYGHSGLSRTLEVLAEAGIATAGAGAQAEAAQRPAVLTTPLSRRVWVFAAGTQSSGIPRDWRATAERGGVNLLEPTVAAADALAARIADCRRPGDIVVVSIHWGGNWGYAVPEAQRRFAHRLIDSGQVDLVHGHSSHHPKGIEVYRGRLVLYGCGDFINDYEGIGGHGQYRGELGLMYFPRLSGEGELLDLELVPTGLKRLQVRYADREQSEWLRRMLEREGRPFNTGAVATHDDGLKLVF